MIRYYNALVCKNFFSSDKRRNEVTRIGIANEIGPFTTFEVETEFEVESVD